MHFCSAFRLGLSAVAAFAFMALAVGGSSSVQAGDDNTATFSPDPLEILEGGSANLKVSIQKTLTAAEATNKQVNLELILPGIIDDTELESASVPVNEADPQEGQQVPISASFELKCEDGQIVAADATIASPAELFVDFPDTAPDTRAQGSGTVECLEIAIVEFDPNPLEIEEGEEGTVKVTFTKHLTQAEALAKAFTVRLMHQGTDTLLGTKQVPFAGQPRVGKKYTLTTSFQLQCKDNMIRGLNDTGQTSAPLDVEFTAGGERAGDGLAECVQKVSSTVPSGGSHPSSVTVDPATGTAYAINAFDGAIGVFDGDQQLDTLQLSCPFQVPAANGPEVEGFDCTYQYIMYLLNKIGGLDALFALDAQTGAAVFIFVLFSGADDAQGQINTAVVPVGTMPTGAAQDPVTGDIYVANSGDDTVSVIDPDSQTVIDTIGVGDGPGSVAADPSAGIIYVSNFIDDTVTVIDTPTNTVVDTIAVGDGPDGIAVDPETGDLYVANFIDDTVSVVSNPAGIAALPSGPTISTVSVGDGPIDVDVNPFANSIYVANTFDDTMSVINRTTLEVTGTFPTGLTPTAVTVNPGEQMVYVANHDVNSLTIFSSPSIYDSQLWGDNNCDGAVDPGDIQLILEWSGVLGEGNSPGCPGLGQTVRVYGYPEFIWGDLNCGGAIDVPDSYDALFYLAGLSATDHGNCPPVGPSVLVD
jgi:YVTN family beta-propeller protein